MKQVLVVLLMLLISVKVGFAELIGKSYVVSGKVISQTFYNNWPDSVVLDSGEAFIFTTTFPGDIRKTFFLAFKSWQGAESTVVTVDGRLARITEVWEPGANVTYQTPSEILSLGRAEHVTVQYRWQPGGSFASTIKVEAKRRVKFFIPRSGTSWLGH